MSIKMFNPDFECRPLGGCSQQCNNVEGSYFCSCDDGYELQTDGFNCLGESFWMSRHFPAFWLAKLILDINECILGTHTCSDYCNNEVGSFSCSCKRGFELDIDQSTCKDQDECALNLHDCEYPAECVNTVGDFECDCPVGYNNVANKCFDINQCLSDSDTCLNGGKCINVDGLLPTGMSQIKNES